MIDALQHLGIDYHFQEEIGAVLHSQYVNCSAGCYPQHDLYEVSTCFRLFRQNGYNVPTGRCIFVVFRLIVSQKTTKPKNLSRKHPEYCVRTWHLCVYSGWNSLYHSYIYF